MSVVSDYELLAQRIRSDQLSAAQVAAHFEDAAFRAWYEARFGVVGN